MPNALRLLSMLCLAPALLTACAAPFDVGEAGGTTNEPAPPVAAPSEGDDDEPSSRDVDPAALVADVCGSVVDEPQGSFAFDELLGVHAQPIDVFAEERVYEISPPGDAKRYVRTLVLAFGESTQECARREGGVAMQTMQEVRLLVSKTSTSGTPERFQPGTYSNLWVEEESGERCVVPGQEEPVSSGTAFRALPVTGTVTIVRRTDSSVEGTFEVTDAEGEVRLAGSFHVPICAVPDAVEPACCAR